MMQRLRRLRSLSALQPSTNLGQEKPTIVVPQSTTQGTDKGNRTSSSKNQSRHREGALDLAKLDSKLQQYAQLRAKEGHVEVWDEAPRLARDSDQDSETRSNYDPEPMGKVQEAFVEVSISIELGDDPTAAIAPGTGPKSGPQSNTIQIIVTPPKDEPPEDTKPSDFDLFLKQAEEDERIRAETGQVSLLPKVKPGPQLNQFYSNDWAGPSPTSPKLAGIQESGEEDGAEADASSTGSEGSSYEGRSDCPGSSYANSGSHDFAGTPEAKESFTQVNIIKPRPGKHVSFCEPVIIRGRSDSQSSAYQARFQSPDIPRTVAKRRSIRKIMVDYIRHK